MAAPESPSITVWREAVRGDMADPEVCAAVGHAVLELLARLGPFPRFETPAVADAFYRAITIAREDAGVRGHWRRTMREQGRERELGAFPEIRLADIGQQLCYDAWELAMIRDRVALAQLALRIDPDCADAYNILVEETESAPTEKQALYEQAMLVGERSLGPELFVQEVGSFWGLVETRPYMRARFALAECLWEQGDHRAAISHFQDLLRLNPNDNQGVLTTLEQKLTLRKSITITWRWRQSHSPAPGGTPVSRRLHDTRRLPPPTDRPLRRLDQ